MITNAKSVKNWRNYVKEKELSEHEIKRLQKAAKTMASNIKRTDPAHRFLLFAEMAKNFDETEQSMSKLFAGIAQTYIRAMDVEAKRKEEADKPQIIIP